ncbi:hypothetical protein QOM21_16685 [Streptomyces sp. Pv4-95]|uniref:DUF6059 family protein n=1 Tax=Streptomyces sp. Pv4-95 TaxID=3049543 RepID=UPI003891DAE0
MPIWTTWSLVRGRPMGFWSASTALLRWIGRMLATAGAMWSPVPLPVDPAEERTLSQPPPGHPERFCPSVPLSAEEQDLARRLASPKESA